jgi:hypothetical protein
VNIHIKYIKLENIQIYFEKSNQKHSKFDYIRVDIYDIDNNLKRYIKNNPKIFKSTINAYDFCTSIIFYYNKNDIKNMIKLLDFVYLNKEGEI